MRFSKTQSALFAALATTVVGTSAQAEGPGLRVGDLAIHPSVFAIGGYDDNVYFAAPQESPLGASLLRIGGGVALENRSPNKISLEGGADVSYRHLFPSGTPENSKAVEARNTLDRAGLNATVGFLPRAPITTELHENLTFRDNPAYEELEIGFRKLDNIAGVDLRFRPGADADSRPFELRLGYRLETVSYLGDKTSEIGADLAEKTAHNLNFLSQWRFLPKTSLLAEVGWSSVHYDRKLEQPAVTAGGTFETTSADRDSRPVYAVVGVKGLITRRISTNLKVGYKNTFNVSGSSYNGVIATAEGTYAIEPTLRATLGYNRDGRDTSFANTYTLNQVYAVTDVYFLGRWSAGGRIGFDYYAYASDAGGVKRLDGDRTDPVVRGSIYAGFDTKDWLSIKAKFESVDNLSNYEIGRFAAEHPAATGGTGAQVDRVAYSRQQFGLEVQARY